MLSAQELTTLVAVGIVAAVLVIFALQVLGTVRKLASEVKLMREALQITVREVPQPQQAEAQPEVRTQAAESPVTPPVEKEAEEARTPSPTPLKVLEGPPATAPQPVGQRPQAPLPEEPLTFSSLDELARHYGLQEVVIFDSAGQVIDYVGSVEPEKVAALLAEAYSVISMSNEGVRLIVLEDDVNEAVAKLETFAEREVYVYVRPSGKIPLDSLRRAISSCSSFLHAMLGVRRG
jgi:hypothetical protein